MTCREFAPRPIGLFEGDRIFLDYAVRCAENLTAILTGRQSPLETIFPAGDFTLAEDLYERAPVAEYFRAIGRAALEGFVRGRRQGSVRVLEIGAGTGSTASALLPALPPDAAEYHFTDVSDAFLIHAQRKFAAYPFVRYGRSTSSAAAGNKGTPRAASMWWPPPMRSTPPAIFAPPSNMCARSWPPADILILCEATEYLAVVRRDDRFDRRLAAIRRWAPRGTSAACAGSLEIGIAGKRLRRVAVFPP